MKSKILTIAVVAVIASAMGAVAQDCPQASLPLALYTDCDAIDNPPYYPSGWMGNNGALERDDCSTDNPHAGSSCIKISYTEEGNWAGIVWQNPPNDWGDEPGGFDLTGATKLTFWARGEKGGESVEFKLGILGQNKPFPDSGKASLGRVKLTADWQQYAIPLEGKNLACIKTGFVWSIAGKKEPLTFYLDDIRYE